VFEFLYQRAEGAAHDRHIRRPSAYVPVRIMARGGRRTAAIMHSGNCSNPSTRRLGAIASSNHSAEPISAHAEYEHSNGFDIGRTFNLSSGSQHAKALPASVLRVARVFSTSASAVFCFASLVPFHGGECLRQPVRANGESGNFCSKRPPVC